jgi:hypothetical protein
MSRTPALVYILYALLAVCLSIAPLIFARYLAAQSALSDAARLYADEPSCRQTSQLPDPRIPIRASALSSSPCRLTGAMVVDKSYTGGMGAGSYALGLRDDTGVDRTVVLGGSGAAAVFNRVSSGLRVIVQLDGNRAMLVGDGTGQIQTRDNPEDIARQNALSVALFGTFSILELIAIATLLAGRRRAAS